jgi:hypothetical protein
MKIGIATMVGLLLRSYSAKWREEDSRVHVQIKICKIGITPGNNIPNPQYNMQYPKDLLSNVFFLDNAFESELDCHNRHSLLCITKCRLTG